EEGRIEGEAEVRSGAFKEVGDTVSAADDESSIEAGRGVGEADAGHPSIPEGVIESAAGPVLSGDRDRPGDDVEVRLFVVRFVEGLVPFPAHAEVKGEVGRYLPVVLKEDSVAPLPL